MRGGRSLFRVEERGGEKKIVLMGLEWNEMILGCYKCVLHYFLSGHEHAHEF